MFPGFIVEFGWCVETPSALHGNNSEKKLLVFLLRVEEYHVPRGVSRPHSPLDTDTQPWSPVTAHKLTGFGRLSKEKFSSIGVGREGSRAVWREMSGWEEGI